MVHDVLKGACMNMPSQAQHPAQASERPVYVGVFLVSAAVLLLQIALTRIFSFTIWYHFAYVTISVALLGYGASGAFLAIFPGASGATPARRLPLYALVCGVSIVMGLVVFAELPFHPFQVRVDPARQIPYMFAFYLAVTTPFFFAGLCISAALKMLSHRVSRLYFSDLLGAGVGCLIVVFAIRALSTPGAVIASAVIVCLASAAFACTGERRALLTPALGTVAVAALGLVVLSVVTFKPSPEKYLYLFMTSPNDIRLYSHRWTPIFRTDVFGFRDEEKSRTGSYAGWGISPYWKHLAATRAPKIRFISHDGDACAVIYNFDGDLAKLEMFDHLILKAPYLLLNRPNVLVIGVGGGTDIVNAIKNHARHVTGVELDPATIDAVEHENADFTGHLFDRPDVTMIAGEGRSTVRRSKTRYDLIELTAVDTLAALSTGAYVLSESYLYTTEAIQEFLDHLTPNGVLSVVVADFNGQIGFPRHTMRQLALYVKALHERGIDDPQNRIAVMTSAEGIPQVAMMLKNSPMTPAETSRLRDFADRMGFHIWALPGKAYPTLHSEYLRTPANAREAFLSRQPLILEATSDDNPFFFNFYKWRDLGKSLGQFDTGHTLATAQIILGLILLFSILFSTVLILLPLFVFKRQGLHTQGRWGLVTFFAGIGLGFILIEISLIQKFVLFLGYPTYSLTVVLFSLLSYSGIGSFLTGRMKKAPEDRLPVIFAGLAVVNLLYLVGLPHLFHAFLGSLLPVRVIIASAVLIPLGLMMGMFFPSGIQIVRRANVAFVPWAWGINGCASVVGTVLAVIMAMSYGFRFVTLAALVIYLAGVVGIRSAARRIAS
jgi:spermidine synthase